MKYYLLFFLCNLLACNINNANSNKTNRLVIASIQKGDSIQSEKNYKQRRQDILKKLVGKWQKKCNDEAGNVIIGTNLDSAIIEVNSNQIVITATVAVINVNNLLELKFKLNKTLDLGAGGNMLSWGNFSRDSIIAKMTIDDSDKCKIRWYGFYDNKLKKRIWAENSDLVTKSDTGNTVAIRKCE